jgi:hypothetical protein
MVTDIHFADYNYCCLLVSHAFYDKSGKDATLYNICRNSIRKSSKQTKVPKYKYFPYFIFSKKISAEMEVLEIQRD